MLINITETVFKACGLFNTFMALFTQKHVNIQYEFLVLFISTHLSFQFLHQAQLLLVFSFVSFASFLFYNWTFICMHKTFFLPSRKYIFILKKIKDSGVLCSISLTESYQCLPLPKYTC